MEENVKNSEGNSTGARAVVDVVIPTYRPGTELRTLLLRLHLQSHAPRNILLINTEEGAFDTTLVEGYSDVRVHHIPKAAFDHGGTRQMALGLTDAEYVLFMTQDALPADKYLVERLVQAISKPNVRIAYARQLPQRDAGVIERYTRRFNYPPSSRKKVIEDLPELGIKTFFCSNVCALYERDVLLELGGFAVPSIFNEDMVFAATALQAGAAIVYEADARVLHSHNYSARQQFHRNFDNGVSEAMHPEVFDGVPTAGEGARLVSATFRHLVKTGHWLLVPKLVVHSAAKLTGFRLGKAYRHLPAFAVRAFTSNRSFWEAGHEETVREEFEKCLK